MIRTRRADGHHIVIEHHERQPPIAFEGMFVVEVEDGLFLPIFQSLVPRHLGIVIVDLSVAAFSIVELARAE